MYELETAWRERLAVPAPGVVPLALGDGLDAESWAAHEFGGAALGDARLSARLVASARHLAQHPRRAITGATQGARALVKGHYRLIDQPADSEVTVENILKPHRQRTLRRMSAHQMVLCIQGRHPAELHATRPDAGTGRDRQQPDRRRARGLHLHTTLAVNPEGVPLGILRAGFDAPRPAAKEAPGAGQSTAPKAREERKSFRWIEGLRDCAQAREQLPDTRVLCTLDREADFVDLFVERREHAPQVELLVRAKVDRVLAKERTADGDQITRRLFEEVRSGPARGSCSVEVSRQSARVKASKQARKQQRTARIAAMTLRYQPVALPCPGAAPVRMWVVHAREQRPPAQVAPLQWFLLSTLPVASAADAIQVLQWYTLRWRIEDYFRVLK